MQVLCKLYFDYVDALEGSHHLLLERIDRMSPCYFALDIHHCLDACSSFSINKVSNIMDCFLYALGDYLVLGLEMDDLILVDCRDEFVGDLESEVGYLTLLLGFPEEQIEIGFLLGVEPYPVNRDPLIAELVPHRDFSPDISSSSSLSVLTCNLSLYSTDASLG